MREEGFVVGAEGLGLGPFGGAGGAARCVGCVGAVVAGMAREGEARCPAHEMVEGPGFHVFGLCVPFFRDGAGCAGVVWLWLYLLYHECISLRYVVLCCKFGLPESWW